MAGSKDLYTFDIGSAEAAIEYLRHARLSVHEKFNEEMEELRQHAHAKNEEWYRVCKNVLPHLYHFSHEFVADPRIPGESFSSPVDFGQKLKEYEMFVEDMATQVDSLVANYGEDRRESLPDLVVFVQSRVYYILDTIRFVKEFADDREIHSRIDRNFQKLLHLARRFHESVTALRRHPRSEFNQSVDNEYDCQCIFDVVLSAWFEDIRREEKMPSAAGSSSQCEFFLPKERALVELKYVKKKGQQKKIKQEIIQDIMDYSTHPNAEKVLFLVYDPFSFLSEPHALINDLSTSRSGFDTVQIVISPPR